MPVSYYQIGGWKPSINWFAYDDKKLAQRLMSSNSPLRETSTSGGQGPIRMILGIKRNGTSHLLIPERKAHDLARVNDKKIPTRPIPASNFESLSFIDLKSEDEVYDILSWLKPKSRKQGEDTDNSRANRHFSREGKQGINRGALEHGRVLYKCIHNDIVLHELGINNKHWLESLQVFSFTLNTIAVDERSSSERLSNPTIIDIGWAEASCHDLLGKPETCDHIIIHENSKLRARGEPKPFEYGPLQTLSKEQAQGAVRELAERWSNSPTILLVHHKKLTMNVLQNCGVKVQDWHSGIRDLFYPNTIYSANSRNRSRSPTRGQGSRQYSDRRPDPPLPVGSVYVIDVKSLFESLMETQVGSDTVPGIARELRFDVTEGYCAGNEAMLLIDIWRGIISGPPIDQQRMARKQQPDPTPAAPSSPPEQPPLNEDDEDFDPNDISLTPLAQPKQTAEPDMYDEAFESDDGRSDSSD
ncbi:hypothetical protein BDN72DRAFT_963568 [Pluteus cervinus]|uniref:Uncharacterized protein n=1 Tax=Pluteus cervinus TaxID=181527 RepID=A0ACD3AF58_9AGAR|nr:hypothetical protein BDN72DRAFT_963568 [Pluteus cervinus]